MQYSRAENIIPKYTMLSVGSIGETFLVQCELDGETITGYIDGGDIIQLSCEEISIEPPPESYERKGCRSSVTAAAPVILVSVSLCGVVMKKKRKDDVAN